MMMSNNYFTFRDFEALGFALGLALVAREGFFGGARCFETRPPDAFPPLLGFRGFRCN